MKVLQLHNRYRHAGGEESVVAAEAEILARSGHEVVRYHIDNPRGHLLSLLHLGFGAWNPIRALEVARVARAERCDLAHVHNTWFSMSPSVLESLQRAGLPTIMTLHNYRLSCINALLLRNNSPCEICIDGSVWNGVRYRCYRESVLASAAAAATLSFNRWIGTWSRNVDLFVAVTDFSRSVFLRMGLPDERLVVKPSFVEDPGPRSSPASRSRDVLYVGRLSQEKGIASILHAWREAGPADLRLLVVGDGPLRAQLETASGEGVSFMGHRSRDTVIQMMLSARALLFPSVSYENQPLVLLEALAAGLPVFGRRIGSIPEVLRGTDPRCLVVSDAAWVDAFHLMADDELIDNASLQCRHAYESKHTPSRAITNLESLYEDACEIHNRRRRAS
jgi:glycosyltransferase involved in cell wall biosynthesis